MTLGLGLGLGLVTAHGALQKQCKNSKTRLLAARNF